MLHMLGSVNLTGVDIPEKIQSTYYFIDSLVLSGFISSFPL